MRALLTVLIYLLLMTLPAAAQNGVDYAIGNIRQPELSPDTSAVILAFDVTNLGGAANNGSMVRVINDDTENEIASQSLRPLGAGESVTILLPLPLELLPPDREQAIRVTVGIGDVEPSTGNVDNNSAVIVVPRLEDLLAQTGQPDTNADGRPDNSLESILEQFGFDTSDPVHMAALAATVVALAILLVLFLIILRLLIVRRKPRYVVQLPPYANVPPMAPSTTAGRRQGWQAHAQNDLAPPSPSDEGSTHIRKLLTGLEGQKLNNWEVTGVRMNQYDQYGRVARSEVVATRDITRRLNKTIDRAADLDEDQISRRVRPVARKLVGQFRRKISPRSAMLPIAIDIAFQGVHGEVRIRFELYYLEQGRWRLVDLWEPEMTVSGRMIHENFTYSLSGLRPGEPQNTFSRRLQDDLTTVLTEMLRHEPPAHDTGASRPIPPLPA